MKNLFILLALFISLNVFGQDPYRFFTSRNSYYIINKNCCKCDNDWSSSPSLRSLPDSTKNMLKELYLPIIQTPKRDTTKIIQTTNNRNRILDSFKE